MATTPTKPAIEVGARLAATHMPPWPLDRGAFAPKQGVSYENAFREAASRATQSPQPSGRDALQALLAFSALHQQVRRRRALASQRNGFEALTQAAEFEPHEQFVLDEVLQLVAERAIAITGADGLGIALAENNEIVLRASAGSIKPDVGARIQRDSAFSGACFRTAKIIRCDDTETDDRVNLYACRQLGTRSMVAVPLCGRRRVIGLLEAFSADPFGFNDSDVASLELLAELILAAIKPQDEDRFAESAQAAEAELAIPALTDLSPEVSSANAAPAIVEAPAPDRVEDVSVAIRTASSIPSLGLEAVTESDKSADDVTASIAPEAAPTASRHPGIMLVLGLIVVAALAASGLWWKIKNAQLGDAIVQPAQQTLTPPAANPQTATPAPSSPAASSAASSTPSLNQPAGSST